MHLEKGNHIPWFDIETLAQSVLLIEWGDGDAYTLDCPLCQSKSMRWSAALQCPDCEKLYLPFVEHGLIGVHDDDGEENRELPCYILRNRMGEMVFLSKDEFSEESNHIIGKNTFEVFAEGVVQKLYESVISAYGVIKLDEKTRD